MQGKRLSMGWTVTSVQSSFQWSSRALREIFFFGGEQLSSFAEVMQSSSEELWQETTAMDMDSLDQPEQELVLRKWVEREEALKGAGRRGKLLLPVTIDKEISARGKKKVYVIHVMENKHHSE